MKPCVLGIFVGGQSKRMGGYPKGLLEHPESSTDTLVDHWLRLASTFSVPCVLVGIHAAYAHFDLPQLPDRPSGVGPIGGLHALLQYCAERKALAVAVACDMPYASKDLLQRLCTSAPRAQTLAPRRPRTRKWEPLFARYDPDYARPVVESQLALREHSLQAVINRLLTTELTLTDNDWPRLEDWDTPFDRLAKSC